MLNSLLIYRLIIVNLVGCLLVGYAASRGWVERIVFSDHTGIVWVCVAFFAFFLFSLAVRALKVAKNLNSIKRREFVRVNEAKFLAKAAHLDDLPGWIMLIGLIGNVVGIVLSIDSANIGAGDAAGSISNLLGSMDVAFGATIVSGVLGVWAGINARVLKTATILMIEDVKSAQLDNMLQGWDGSPLAAKIRAGEA